MSPALIGGFFTTEPPGKPLFFSYLATRSSSWDLSSQPGIVSGPRAVKELNRNCQTTKELPGRTNYGFGINRQITIHKIDKQEEYTV